MPSEKMSILNIAREFLREIPESTAAERQFFGATVLAAIPRIPTTLALSNTATTTSTSRSGPR